MLSGRSGRFLESATACSKAALRYNGHGGAPEVRGKAECTVFKSYGNERQLGIFGSKRWQLTIKTRAGGVPALRFSGVTKRPSAPPGRFQGPQGREPDIRRANSSGPLGPNNAGKTTLISILAGLPRPAWARPGDGRRRAARLRPGAQAAGPGAAGAGLRPFFSVREILVDQSVAAGIRTQRGLDRSSCSSAGPGRQGPCQHAPALRRHEAARAPRPWCTGPPVIVLDEPTAGWTWAAPNAVAVHRPPEPKGRPRGAAGPRTTWKRPRPLCQRIAMLKQGQVVALDHTSALLAGKTAPCCASRPTASCRLPWPPRPGAPAASLQMKAHDAQEIEGLLARCARQA